MKKLLLLPILIMPFNAMGLGTCSTCTPMAGTYTEVNFPTNCKNYTMNCKRFSQTGEVAGICVCGYSCITCEDGYINGVINTHELGIDCYIEYSNCVVGGGGTTTPTCYTSNGSTTGNGTGCVSYSKGSTTVTRCDSCSIGYTASESYLEMCDGSTSKQYQCVKEAPSVCTEDQYLVNKTCIDCPNGGTTGKLFGGSAVTDCYLPAGTAFTDDAGSGTYTSDCYYTSDRVLFPGVE